MHLTILLTLAFSLTVHAFELPFSSQQCILGLADDWNSSHATLQLYQKSGPQWKPVGKPMAARLGKNGLAWGRGIHPLPKHSTLKKEGDWRAPAGVFTLGGVWGYEMDVKRHPALPYHRITERDLWVEDPQHPAYNRHLVLDHAPATAWEKKQQMKQSDPAHALKLFIAHNAAPDIRPGMGSSIFFHIWRSGGSKPSAGCTTMAEHDLRTIITWLDPEKAPLYVLLPRTQYDQLCKSWKLPAPMD